MASKKVNVTMGLLMVVGAAACMGAAGLPPPLPPRGTPPQVERVSPKVTTPTRVEFKQTTKDVGTVFDHEEVELDFEFTNAGDHDLEIVNVRSSCGCTAAEPEKTLYKPGESGKIHVTFNPKGKHGAQHKTVYIECNDLSGKDIELHVEANVIQLVEVNPSTISLGTVPKGESMTTTFTVTGRTEDFEAMRATVIRNLDMFEIKSLGTEAFEEDGEKLRRTTFEMTLKPSKTVGRFDDELTIRTNDPRREIVTAPVIVSIQGDIAVAPMRIALGRPKLGETFEREFTVANRKGEPFKLLGIEFEDGPAQIEFESHPADPDKMDVYKVRMKVTAARVNPRISQDIIIRTDVDGEEEIRVPVTGVIQTR
ncbi:MAG: DUF1573 domain-containing protein [Phycisphaerales bacterium]